LKLRPRARETSVASWVGFTTEAMIARTPVTASRVFMPPFVRAETEARSSSNPTPALAAIGATLPMALDNSVMVVLPAFMATNIASETAVALSTLLP